MTRDEMRFLRREIINTLMHMAIRRGDKYTMAGLKSSTRINEFMLYGSELRAYSGNWQNVT